MAEIGRWIAAIGGAIIVGVIAFMMIRHHGHLPFKKTMMRLVICLAFIGGSALAFSWFGVWVVGRENTIIAWSGDALIVAAALILLIESVIGIWKFPGLPVVVTALLLPFPLIVFAAGWLHATEKITVIPAVAAADALKNTLDGSGSRGGGRGGKPAKPSTAPKPAASAGRGGTG